MGHSVVVSNNARGGQSARKVIQQGWENRYREDKGQGGEERQVQGDRFCMDELIMTRLEEIQENSNQHVRSNRVVLCLY